MSSFSSYSLEKTHLANPLGHEPSDKRNHFMMMSACGVCGAFNQYIEKINCCHIFFSEIEWVKWRIYEWHYLFDWRIFCWQFFLECSRVIWLSTSHFHGIDSGIQRQNSYQTNTKQSNILNYLIAFVFLAVFFRFYYYESEWIYVLSLFFCFCALYFIDIFAYINEKRCVW